MYASVSWSGCLGFSVHRTWRCKNVLECLQMWYSMNISSSLLKARDHFTFTNIKPWRRPFVGSCSSYAWNLYRKIGHWSPGTESSPERSLSLILGASIRTRKQTQNLLSYTYSGFFQSSPAGQSNAPVTSWLKPRPVLEFREMGGTKGSPGGIIQSMIADFKLLVSSDLALDTPFWSW